MKITRKKIVVTFLLILIVLPLLVAISSYFRGFVKNIYDKPDFWFGYMAYFGTVVLAGVAYWQNENAHRINEKLLNMEKIRSRSYINIKPYKNFNNYDQYEKYLCDNVLGIWNESSALAIKHSENNGLCAQKILASIEFNLVGDLPVFDVSIAITMKYKKNEKNGTTDVLDNNKERKENVNIYLFDKNIRYLQLIPYEQDCRYYIYNITIIYKTQYNENIKIVYQLHNLEDSFSKNDIISISYYTIEDSKESLILDGKKHKILSYQKNSANAMKQL